MSRGEIKTLSEFNQRINHTNGYIVIIDKPLKRSTIHRTTCSNLEERHFKQKVIDNNNKNGNYYWIDSIEEAANELKAVWCLHCKNN